MQVSRAHTRCSSADTKLSYSREIQRTKSLTVNVSTMEPPLCMNPTEANAFGTSELDDDDDDEARTLRS